MEPAARSRNRDPKLYRAVLGVAYLGLTAMLLFGVYKYSVLIVPRYGNRFTYLALIMIAVACWTCFKAVMVVRGRTRGR